MESKQLYTIYRNKHREAAKLRRQRNTAQMNEQTKAPETTQLINEEIANLSDAEFKTLVIRMLTELAEYGHKIEEKVKAIQSEKKENVQGTNHEGKETGTQINSLGHKGERTFNQNRMKKQEFKKMRRGLGTSRTSLNVLTSDS